METRKKKNIKPVIARILAPPYDEGEYATIGHWDENEKKFTSLNDEVMDRFIQAQWEGFKAFPMVVNIKKTEMDGELHVYRALGVIHREERTILFIDHQDITMPTYKDLIDGQNKRDVEHLIDI